MVFDSDRDGRSEVYILSIDSREVTRLTRRQETGLTGRLPDFAPGGRQIVFVSATEEGVGQLFLVDSDGGGMRQLTTEEAIYENPAWSPSGQWIAFEKAEQGVWSLYRIRPDGSDVQRIGPEGVNLFHPSWSPDEDRIAVVTGSEEAWVAGVLDLASGTVELLTEQGLDIGSVKWSPDGSRLALDAVVDSNFDLYLLDLATKKLQRLTEHPGIDARPDWSPDGSHLVFHSTRDRGGSVAGLERREQFELHLLDLESGATERLTENASVDAHPDWCGPQAGSPRNGLMP